MSCDRERQAQFLENACDATRLLGKRRQLFDTKERFAAEKTRYEEQCKILAQKDAELTKRDLELQAKVSGGESRRHRGGSGRATTESLNVFFPSPARAVENFRPRKRIQAGKAREEVRQQQGTPRKRRSHLNRDAVRTCVAVQARRRGENMR